MVQACPPQRFIGLRDRAMLLLGYVLLTASELVAMDVEDLQLVDQGLVVVVPRRRPDPGGSRFRVVAVPYLKQQETCPVRAWLAWQEATGLHTGPAFRPVPPRRSPRLAQRAGTPSEDPGRAEARSRSHRPAAQTGRPTRRPAGLAALRDSIAAPRRRHRAASPGR